MATVTVMVMGGAITGVAVTTTVGIEAVIVAGDIITIGGDFHPLRDNREMGRIVKRA